MITEEAAVAEVEEDRNREGECFLTNSLTRDEGEEDEGETETLHVLVQLPRGTRVTSIYFDQLSGLDTAT